MYRSKKPAKISNLGYTIIANMIAFGKRTLQTTILTKLMST